VILSPVIFKNVFYEKTKIRNRKHHRAQVSDLYVELIFINSRQIKFRKYR
jgi:hypothetical protein